MADLSLNKILLPHERIIAALDQQSWDEAVNCAKEIKDVVGIAKVNSVAERIGLDRAMEVLNALGLVTMIDYKLNDIDDTMYRRAREETLAGGDIITIHASTTQKALRRAVAGVDAAMAMKPRLQRPWLLGVTVLTSIDDNGVETCASIFGADRRTKVRQFTHLAADAGFQGVVCSYQEAEIVKNDPYTQHMKVVLAGIRPVYSRGTPDEQILAVTPKIAIEAGGDFLIFGRPLIYAPTYGLTSRGAAIIIGEEIKDAGG